MIEPKRLCASSGSSCLGCVIALWSCFGEPCTLHPRLLHFKMRHDHSHRKEHMQTAHSEEEPSVQVCTGRPKPSADKHTHLRRLLGAPKEADAYAVMGLEPDAKGADVKRRYMRLSLLIHPDKCSHPQAQHAFQAVSKASKELQVCPGACRSA